MRAIIQRVSKAKCIIDNKVYSEISNGLLVLVGITASDNIKLLNWFANKIINLRIFNDENNKMNLSVKDIKGGILVISNFTLYGDAIKGFRPSFIKAANPEISEPLYNEFMNILKRDYEYSIASGVFGAMMDLEFTNNGPVTIMIEKESD